MCFYSFENMEWFWCAVDVVKSNVCFGSLFEIVVALTQMCSEFWPGSLIFEIPVFKMGGKWSRTSIWKKWIFFAVVDANYGCRAIFLPIADNFMGMILFVWKVGLGVCSEGFAFWQMVRSWRQVFMFGKIQRSSHDPKIHFFLSFSPHNFINPKVVPRAHNMPISPDNGHWFSASDAPTNARPCGFGWLNIYCTAGGYAFLIADDVWWWLGSFFGWWR